MGVIKMKVNIDQMKKLGWANITQESIDELNNGITKFKIISVNELCHFLAQVSHECGCGRWPREIWGPTKTQLTYEGRAGLGNNQPGDGFKFRGAGYIQMTGRYNYTAFSKYIGDPKVIDIGADYVAAHYCWISAFYWWMNNSMGQLCATNPSVSIVTKRVNGGQNGEAEREAYYAKCCNIFTSETVGVATTMTSSSTPRKVILPTQRKFAPTNDATVVKKLQETLNTKGFDCGTPDGVFGPNTDKAVRAFQKRFGLTSDGIVGPVTWKALGF